MKEVVDLLSKTSDTPKFILILIAFVLVPQAVQLIISILNRKNVNHINKDYTAAMMNFQLLMEVVKSDIKAIKENNSEECTIKQIEVAFTGCVSNSIVELVKRTKNVIFLNSIEDRTRTTAKVVKLVKDVMNNNKAQLSAFKRHGIPVSDFVDDKWACELVDVIVDFIYKNATDKKYNYDVLGMKLNETFEAFAYTFNKNVAQCKLKDN